MSRFLSLRSLPLPLPLITSFGRTSSLFLRRRFFSLQRFRSADSRFVFRSREPRLSDKDEDKEDEEEKEGDENVKRVKKDEKDEKVKGKGKGGEEEEGEAEDEQREMLRTISVSSSSRTLLHQTILFLLKCSAATISPEYADAVIRSLRMQARASSIPLTAEENASLALLFLHVKRVGEAVKIIRHMVETNSLTTNIVSRLRNKAAENQYQDLVKRLSELLDQFQARELSKSTQAAPVLDAGDQNSTARAAMPVSYQNSKKQTVRRRYFATSETKFI